MPVNRVEIGREGVDPPPWQERAASFAAAVLEKLEKHNWDLSVLFCGNAFIRSLNARYRNRDEATDILSFGLGETDGERYLPGDIVISLEKLTENADYFKVSPDEELRRLLIHGILHLSGMDHAGCGREEPMLKKQEALLGALGTERIMSV
ncbi:MAG: rRNA maturation RNase YbeY [Treponema sp.]|jgi:probable rRNA maturation factor|nr:rRNA maturation RNase YbeY [Treponema sp.]